METPNESLFLDPIMSEYAAWQGDLTPRTCLLVHWLANLGAVPAIDVSTRSKARRFAEKRQLLGRLVDGTENETNAKTNWLIENGEFDLYVTWLMWLRFQEYIPGRFVLPEGRQKVLKWVRTQLRRFELTDEETLVELRWQVDRLRESIGTHEDDPKLFL